MMIVHAANPPGYKNWRGLALPMLKNTIAAAVATLWAKVSGSAEARTTGSRGIVVGTGSDGAVTAVSVAGNATLGSPSDASAPSRPHSSDSATERCCS